MSSLLSRASVFGNSNLLAAAAKVPLRARHVVVGNNPQLRLLAATEKARQWGGEVYRVDLASVVGRYIGETEKNLRELLAAAEASQWILFFDEADSLFGRRTSVGDSHDRYANQEVSYLLQRLEESGGAVILGGGLDSPWPAWARRRFGWPFHRVD